ncbi:unnamed protein product [Periconia digitata]|uniref:Uncharacterized protein n=1 Tax=Periconia digitata TaxID=1303443 RepID=A0A9W4XEL2_9PLEO|nr:unnamed protein product [Periconia digitata]
MLSVHTKPSPYGSTRRTCLTEHCRRNARQNHAMHTPYIRKVVKSMF